MPEEKVSSVKIPKNAGELANNWDKHEKVSDPQRGQWVQRCVTWSFPHQCCIQPLPPAADAGPRQLDIEGDLRSWKSLRIIDGVKYVELWEVGKMVVERMAKDSARTEAHKC